MFSVLQRQILLLFTQILQNIDRNTVAFVGITIPATVLIITSDSEVQHLRTKRATCHRSTWTTNTLQLRLTTDSCPLSSCPSVHTTDTEESNRVSSGPRIDSLEILWVSFVFCCLLRQTLLDAPHSASLFSSQNSHPTSQLNPSQEKSKQISFWGQPAHFIDCVQNKGTASN